MSLGWALSLAMRMPSSRSLKVVTVAAWLKISVCRITESADKGSRDRCGQ